MSSTAESLKSIFQQSIVEHGNKHIFNTNRFEVDITDISKLSEKILLLPQQLQILLYMRHKFNLGPDAVKNILYIENPKEKLYYAEALLAYTLGLPENHYISKSCLEKASIQALDQYVQTQNTSLTVLKPNYSKKLRNQLSEIKAAQRYNTVVVLKRTWITIVAAIISFIMTISASAELREQFFNWLIERFPLFSQYSVIDSSPVNFNQLKNMELKYTPIGYVLVEVFEADPIVVYRYENKFQKVLSISARVPNDSPILYDTEGIQINEVNVRGQVAYWWEKNGFCYFIWQKDGIEINIIGQIGLEDAIRIAKNIKF